MAQGSREEHAVQTLDDHDRFAQSVNHGIPAETHHTLANLRTRDLDVDLLDAAPSTSEIDGIPLVIAEDRAGSLTDLAEEFGHALAELADARVDVIGTS